jgi:6-phosphogluconolactonase
MNIQDYPDRDFLMMRTADQIASELRAALGHEERVRFAVPGGTTPGPVFDILSHVDLDWARVDVLPTDERWVPETSDRSNARLIRRRLLTGRAAAARFHPLWRDTARPETALDEVNAAVTPLLPLNVVLLGMGEDMHCASLFPGGDRLDEAIAPRAPAVLPMRVPGEDELRITLTLPVLAGAMSIHLLITGMAKREALLRARELGPAEAPVAGVLGNAIVHWAE